MIDIKDKKECCGCEACVQRCPKHCIEMKQDDEYFYYPKINTQICINCGLCEKVCPLLHPDIAREPKNVYAAKNPNKEERMQSSSGGVFIVLAHYFIKRGGIVFGVVYDNNWNTCFTSAETMDEIGPMMSSKYVQAIVGEAYRKVETYLKTGREVLFTGVPCQIAGLKRFLRKEYDNLFCLDVLCAGVPSPGVWSKYVKEDIISVVIKNSRKKTNKDSSLKTSSLIDNINFRDKSLYGWEKYSFAVCGKTDLTSSKKYFLLYRIHDENPFMQGFLSSIYKRPSCHCCKFRKGESGSDMTIGDFWGVYKLMPDFADNKGISIVLIRTDNAERIFHSLRLIFRKSNFQKVKSLNGGFNENIKVHPKREVFYRVLHEGGSFDSAIQAAMHLDFIERMYLLIKRICRKSLSIIGLRHTKLYQLLLN